MNNTYVIRTFENEKLNIFDEVEIFIDAIKSIEENESVLLFMSSENYIDINITEPPEKIVKQ